MFADRRTNSRRVRAGVHVNVNVSQLSLDRRQKMVRYPHSRGPVYGEALLKHALMTSRRERRVYGRDAGERDAADAVVSGINRADVSFGYHVI